MNQSNHSINGVVARPVPLFASSWVALYCYLRNFLNKDHAQRDAPAKSPETEAKHITH